MYVGPNRLGELRKAAGLSQRAAAKILGFSAQSISDMETGQYGALGLKRAEALARAYGVSIDEIVRASRTPAAKEEVA